MAFFARSEAGLLQRFRAGERQTLEAVYRAYVDSVATRRIGRPAPPPEGGLQVKEAAAAVDIEVFIGR